MFDTRVFPATGIWPPGVAAAEANGGAKGSGAPPGDGNYRHGRFTAEAIRERRMLREWIKVARKAATEVE